MKIAVSSYSFSRLLTAGRMNQLDCIAKAKEMGFDAIEIVDVLPHDGSSAEDYARRLREEAERVGLPISNYTVGADFLTGSGGDLEAEIRRVQGQVDMAVLLGAPSMRHDATGGYERRAGIFRAFDAVLPRLADGCRRVTEYAAAKGVRTMVENHGFFCQDSDRVEKLAAAVDHPNFGLLVDMGNFLCADDDPVRACGRVAPYAFNVHAKDFHIKDGMLPDPGRGYFRTRGGQWLRGAIVGHGNVPVRQCLRVMKDAGYDGAVAIEFEGMEDPLEGIAIGLENLRRYIAEA